MVRNIFDFGYYILFNFMITDDTEYLLSNPTKHTSEAKKHSSVPQAALSCFNDIQNKILHKTWNKRKEIENTKFRTRKRECQFHLRRAYFVPIFSDLTLYRGTDWKYSTLSGLSASQNCAFISSCHRSTYISLDCKPPLLKHKITLNIHRI